jgi:DNA-binding transcriptional ArsR family regulator
MNACACENDLIRVKVWQDIFVTDSSESPAPRPARHPVSNVELLKALADPLRMSMMYVLTRNTSQHGMPVMTVKELAAELGEPQTKLYRHVKQLEAAGLIAAVSSRIVSGIVEQRYQAIGSTFIGDDLTEGERTSPEAEAMVAAALDMFRREYFGALRARQSDQQAEVPAHRRPLMALTDGRVPASRAAAIRAQLRELIEEVNADPAPDTGDLVPINVLVGFFGSDPPPSS